MKKTITDQELKEMYHELDHKGKFIISTAEKLKVSQHTVKGWFIDALFTSDIPKDANTRKVLKRELEKAPKKVTA